MRKQDIDELKLVAALVGIVCGGSLGTVLAIMAFSKYLWS